MQSIQMIHLLIKKPEIILALSQSQQKQLITKIKMIARMLTKNTKKKKRKQYLL